MFKQITFLIFALFLLNEALGEDHFQAGNEKFLSKDYSGAIHEYKASLSEQQSSEQHYNLANAYFKNQQLGPAILHYKKALAISPRDKETLANLELSEIAARLDFKKGAPVARFAETFPVNTWVVVLSVAFWLFWGITLLAPLYKWHGTTRVITQTLSVTLWGLCVTSLYHYHTQSKTAIVLSPKIALKVSPTQSSPSLCTIKEGCCAKVCKEHEGYCFIETPDKEQGWIEKNQLAKVWE